MSCSTGRTCPRHPPRPPKPPPLLWPGERVSSSAWRWPVGGPITDFGDEGEAGPSTVPIADCCCADERPTASPPRRRRRLRTTTRIAAAAAAAATLLTLPSVAAGPLPSPPTQTPSPTTTPTPVMDIQARSIRTEPLYTAITIPSFPVTHVPETVLPAYLTKSDDGRWYKVDQPWSLYGRVASNVEATPTAAGVAYAVQSQMPPGWGSRSKRASFYNTPMIVAASVILGILIVFAIIVITYQRRKEARRKKRHAARMRKKALAAAGLTEDNLKEAGSMLEADFKQRLAELEKAHAAKRREKRAQKEPSAFVRTKVRVWRSNIRRRKSPRTSRDDDDNELKEQWTPEGGHFQRNNTLPRPGSPGSLLTRDDSSFMSDSSRSPSPLRTLSRAGLGVSSTGEPTTGSETAAETAPSAVESGEGPRTSGEVGDVSLSPTTSAAREGTSSSSLSDAHPPAPGGAAHMPPAYRPASVRSLNVAGPSSSSRAPPESPTPNVLSPEKASAAGFYPAPATADAELAQAVVRRGDAKAPIIVPPEDEEQRAMRHVATDDKRELERLRLGASAPPVRRVDDVDEDGAGPSAPTFDVDGEGFETLATPEGEREDESPVRPTRHLGVPGLPAPPSSTPLRSLRTFGTESDVHLRPSAPPSPVPSAGPSAPPLSEPSAPPLAPSAPPLDLEPSAPSAPPLDDWEDDVPTAPSAPPAPTISVASAPPLHDEDHGGSGTPPRLTGTPQPSRVPSRATLHRTPSEADIADVARETDRELENDAEQAHGAAHAHPAPTAEVDADPSDVAASLNVGGHGFLPRYEP